eukprot:NODE_4936_length_741_cov_20.953757_g4580_i0.p1 GENE.NODE_4936_length_741_cov_20.953757_g4580_i0~~NODE_4936_length_741_cov_20.953757_g4580_i0.p1  ORF type:complete len:224 (+),score=31.66 NODE_4936_length_741_cov_20.953757_g4580_i0:29-700(+)
MGHRSRSRSDRSSRSRSRSRPRSYRRSPPNVGSEKLEPSVKAVESVPLSAVPRASGSSRPTAASVTETLSLPDTSVSNSAAVATATAPAGAMAETSSAGTSNHSAAPCSVAATNGQLGFPGQPVDSRSGHLELSSGTGVDGAGEKKENKIDDDDDDDDDNDFFGLNDLLKGREQKKDLAPQATGASTEAHERLLFLVFISGGSFVDCDFSFPLCLETSIQTPG